MMPRAPAVVEGRDKERGVGVASMQRRGARAREPDAEVDDELREDAMGTSLRFVG